MTPAAALRDLALRIAPHLPAALRDEAVATLRDAADALDAWDEAVCWETEIEQMCRAVALDAHAARDDDARERG